MISTDKIRVTELRLTTNLVFKRSSENFIQLFATSPHNNRILLDYFNQNSLHGIALQNTFNLDFSTIIAA